MSRRSSSRSLSAPKITLENFNQNSSRSGINSPRSVAACRRLGLVPDDLCVKPESFFYEQMRRAVTGAQAVKPELVTQRYRHHENRRRQFLSEARAERKKLMQKHTGAYVPTAVALIRSKGATMVEKEKRQVWKMQQIQRHQLNTLLMNEIIKHKNEARIRRKMDQAARKAAVRQAEMDARSAAKAEETRQKLLKKKKQEEDDAREARRQANLQYQEDQRRLELLRRRKEAQMRAQAEAVRMSNERAENRKRDLEAAAEAYRQRLMMKKADMAKAEQRRAAMAAQQQAERQKRIEDSQERARERWKRMRENHENLLMTKRQNFEERERIAEARRQWLEDMRQEEMEKRRQRALEHEEAIQATLSAAEARLEARRQAYFDKEAALARRKREQDKLDKLEGEKRRKMLEEKQNQRDIVYKRNRQQMEERANAILQKRALAERRGEIIRRARQKALDERKMAEALADEDRREHAARIARQQEYEREVLLQKIRADTERVQIIKSEYDRLASKRQMLQYRAEQQKKRIRERMELLRDKLDWETLANMDPEDVDVVKLGIVQEEELDVGGLGDYAPPASKKGSRRRRRRSRSQVPARLPAPTSRNDNDAAADEYEGGFDDDGSTSFLTQQ